MNEKGYENISAGNDTLINTVCTICKRNLSSENELKQHRNWCQYACSFCGISFDDKQLYTQHRCKSYSCDQCFKSFHSEIELAAHAKTHTSPINCVIPSCRVETFASKLTLRDHIFKKHTKQVTFRNGKKPYICLLDQLAHICSGSYDDRSKILRHISSVAQYKPFNCPKCQKSFSEAYNVNKHLRNVHSVIDESWTCCGKQFTMKSHFRVHARTFCPTKGRLATINFRNLNTTEVQIKKEHYFKKRRKKAKITKDGVLKTAFAEGEDSTVLELLPFKLMKTTEIVSENIKPRIKREKKRKAGSSNIGNVEMLAPNISIAECDSFVKSSLLSRKRPSRERPRNMTMTGSKVQVLVKPSSEDKKWIPPSVWEELPELASADYKWKKSSSCDNIPIVFWKNENLQFISSTNDYSPSKVNKFSEKPFSDAEISAKVKSPLGTCPNKSKRIQQSFKDEPASDITSTYSDLPSLSSPNYQVSRPKHLELSPPHNSIFPSSGLRSANDCEDKDFYNLPLLGDLNSKAQKVDATLLSKGSCRQENKLVHTNHELKKWSKCAVLFDSDENNTTLLKPCKSTIRSQLEVAENKLRAISAIVNGWRVKGTTVDMQMLLKEIRKNL